ncbi:RHS repeat-associated core domain-containing protein, partial [Chryseobacterium sp. Tr-659]|uniref:RHS repeat-associated core domain-containing protein n=1 Tax=Chryseobacterium sp. Tr-659 TaxID=2608340 RepID=UPI00293C09DF
YIYNYTDHLGNVRLSYFHNGSGIEVLEENNYYPFGLKHEGYNPLAGNPMYQYKYNGKELQESGMYDYGARMYMPDLGRWGVIDPLAETSRRWSTYTYAYNNPIRFIDPDGRQAEDKIKIFNNGTIERTKDNNAYDTITNEDESKSIKIARTNVTEKNPTGDSQIGDAKKLPFEIKGSGESEGSASSTYTYLQIENYDVATQFFEFAAENTDVEFSQDTFNFNDGYSTSIISTNHSVDQSYNAGFMLAPYAFGGHVIQDGTHTENVHSHPSGTGYAPSGFAGLFMNGKVSYGYNPLHGDGEKEGGDRVLKQIPGLTRFLYSRALNKRMGGGYVQYDNKNATYKGKTK